MRFIRWIPLLFTSTALATNMPPTGPSPNQPMPPSEQPSQRPMTYEECEHLRRTIEGRGGLTERADGIMREEIELRQDLKKEALELGALYALLQRHPEYAVEAMESMQIASRLLHDQQVQIEDAKRRQQAVRQQIEVIRARMERFCPRRPVDATPPANLSPDTPGAVKPGRPA